MLCSVSVCAVGAVRYLPGEQVIQQLNSAFTSQVLPVTWKLAHSGYPVSARIGRPSVSILQLGEEASWGATSH